MKTITLTWEDWRAVIGILPEKVLAFTRERFDRLVQQFEQHSPD